MRGCEDLAYEWSNFTWRTNGEQWFIPVSPDDDGLLEPMRVYPFAVAEVDVDNATLSKYGADPIGIAYAVFMFDPDETQAGRDLHTFASLEEALQEAEALNVAQAKEGDRYFLTDDMEQSGEATFYRCQVAHAAKAQVGQMAKEIETEDGVNLDNLVMLIAKHDCETSRIIVNAVCGPEEAREVYTSKDFTCNSMMRWHVPQLFGNGFHDTARAAQAVPRGSEQVLVIVCARDGMTTLALPLDDRPSSFVTVFADETAGLVN